MQIMKKLLMLIPLAFVSTPAKADEQKKLEITYQALNAVDLIQTASCLKAHTCVESNPIYGKHPKVGTIVAGKVASGLIHYFITKEMIKEYGEDSEPVRIWLYSTIALQESVVALNFRIIL